MGNSTTKDEEWIKFLKVCERPFARLDMTREEYDEEVRYLGEHFDEYMHGNYKSLYEQRKAGIIE